MVNFPFVVSNCALKDSGAFSVSLAGSVKPGASAAAFAAATSAFLGSSFFASSACASDRPLIKPSVQNSNNFFIEAKSFHETRRKSRAEFALEKLRSIWRETPGIESSSSSCSSSSADPRAKPRTRTKQTCTTSASRRCGRISSSSSARTTTWRFSDVEAESLADGAPSTASARWCGFGKHSTFNIQRPTSNEPDPPDLDVER